MKEKDFERLRQLVVLRINSYLDKYVPQPKGEEGIFSVELGIEVSKIFDRFRKKVKK